MENNYELIGNEKGPDYTISLYFNPVSGYYFGDIDYDRVQTWGCVNNFTVYEPVGYYKKLKPILHQIVYGLDYEIDKTQSEKIKHMIAMILLRRIKNA